MTSSQEPRGASISDGGSDRERSVVYRCLKQRIRCPERLVVRTCWQLLVQQVGGTGEQPETAESVVLTALQSRGREISRAGDPSVEKGKQLMRWCPSVEGIADAVSNSGLHAAWRGFAACLGYVMA